MQGLNSNIFPRLGYDYPIKRGTVEWNSIKDYQSLRNACQIPIEVVNQMTSEALLESVLNYPLLGDAFVFNSFQKGIENLKINFNAFDALSNRTDLGRVLRNKYLILAVKKFDTESLIVKGGHSVKLSFLELLFGQSFTNNTLTKDQSITVIKTLIDSMNEKKKNGEIYGMMSLSTCAWALQKLLIFNNADEKFTVKGHLTENGNVFSQQILNEVQDKAQRYIQNTTK